MYHFWAQNGPFVLNNVFLVQTIIITFIYLPVGPFHFAKFKKILTADSELWGCAIVGPKMAHLPKWEFFQKTCQWALFVSFMPIYIPKNKVRYYSITEILTIKEYWNLTDWEPFLPMTWEPDFSQTSSFRRMLMNHRNFHFTQIRQKTNDVIFLKSPETMFLGHFWPFLVICAWLVFFPKKIQLSHKTIYGPLTPC